MSTTLLKHIGLKISVLENGNALRDIDAEKTIRLKEWLLSPVECVCCQEKCIPEISHFQVINLQ